MGSLHFQKKIASKGLKNEGFQFVHSMDFISLCQSYHLFWNCIPFENLDSFSIHPDKRQLYVSFEHNFSANNIHFV